MAKKFPNADGIAGVIYSNLKGKTTVCFIAELCTKAPLLQENEDHVRDVLARMCEDDSVAQVGCNFILKDNLFSSKVSQQPPVKVAVPAQQRPAWMNENKEWLLVYRDIINKIIQVLGRSRGDLDAVDIAQQTGIERARINRYLYFLKNKEVLSMNNRNQWKLVKPIKDEEVMQYGVELAKEKREKPLEDTTAAAEAATASNGCTHLHVHHHYHHHHQHHHHHNNNIQIGDNCTMNCNLSENTLRKN